MTNYNQFATIFCPGHGNSRVQAAKYAGPDGLLIMTDQTHLERISMPGAPLLLHNILPYPELKDVGYGWTLNPLHLCFKFFAWLLFWFHGIQGASLPHNYVTELNFGGESDVRQYLSAIRRIIRLKPKKRLVLFGTSRGAAVLLVALTRLTIEERQHIALAIAEGSYDSVPNLITGFFGPVAPYIMSVMEKTSKFNRKQMSPLEAVSHPEFPLDLPLAFVCSELDGLVPRKSTESIIQVLRERSHASLHELWLKESHHSNMSIDNRHDQEDYLQFMSALYEKVGS